MTLLVLGLILFLGIHSLSIVAPGKRDAMARNLGNGPSRAFFGDRDHRSRPHH